MVKTCYKYMLKLDYCKINRKLYIKRRKNRNNKYKRYVYLRRLRRPWVRGWIGKWSTADTQYIKNQNVLFWFNFSVLIFLFAFLFFVSSLIFSCTAECCIVSNSFSLLVKSSSLCSWIKSLISLSSTSSSIPFSNKTI